MYARKTNIKMSNLKKSSEYNPQKYLSRNYEKHPYHYSVIGRENLEWNAVKQ